jgi:uncharacterized protein YbjT (DUF2867 family)
MATTIVVAGATGVLGGRIAKALIERGADVRALVRDSAGNDKLAALERVGAKVAKVDLSNASAAARALEGAACVVSTLQGLGDVIVEAQSALLTAAIAAGVPRFIPSDYSVDFTKLDEGENRNFDLRRAFHSRLDNASIAWTSILSGANMELLTRAMPLLDLKSKRVTYWGQDADQRLDFTATNDTAAFTAAAALDASTPRTLRIAGDQISARELAILAGEITGATFELVRLGSLDGLAGFIHHERATHPESENELFPVWQQSQYMHNMFSGRAKLEPLDNDRYPEIQWTRIRDLISVR